MPYTFKKQGNKYAVYKKSTGKKIGTTSLSKEALRKYLAALHINVKNETIYEDDKQVRDAEIQTAIEDIKAKELALKNSKEKLVKLRTSVAETSLSEYAKSILEADEADPNAEPDSKMDAEEPEKNLGSTTPKPVKIKFNLAKVKKYNTYPISGNEGYINSANTEGLSVIVDDSIIMVNFEDILD